MQPIIIYITFPEIEIANEITRKLIEHKLIACANIFKNVESIYS